jgi:thioredoxin 1
VRCAASALLLSLAAATAHAQDAATPPAGPHQEANEWFFGVVMALILAVPFLVVVLVHRRRSRSRPSELPVFTDANFREEVLESRMPVLVHFAEEWSIANAAAKSQTEVVAYRNRGALKVGTLHVGENPEVMERLPGFEPPAYLLFYGGRKLFHRPGLMQAEDLQEEIDRALAREGF